MGPCSKSEFVCTEIGGPSSTGLRLLHGLYLGRDLSHDRPCHLLLHLENVLQNAVVAFRPDVIASWRVDELTGHPDPIGQLADAALQHVADAELPTDLPDVG